MPVRTLIEQNESSRYDEHERPHLLHKGPGRGTGQGEIILNIVMRKLTRRN